MGEALRQRTSEVETIYSACSPATGGDTLGVRSDVRVRLTRGLEAPVFNDLIPAREQSRAYDYPESFSSTWMPRRGIETDTGFSSSMADVPDSKSGPRDGGWVQVHLRY